MKILVTGCARSGTTLMANLIHASFANVTYLPDEVFPSDDTFGITMGKLPSVARRVSSLVEEYPDLRVVFMIRNPRAVLLSRHWKDPDTYWSCASEWCDAARQWLATHGHRRVTHVRFEDLVQAPERAEAQVSYAVGLYPCRAFRVAWHHFCDTEENLRALGGARPLDSTRTTPRRTPNDDIYLDYLYQHSDDLRRLTEQAGYAE